jgi:uncharacterized protein
LQRNLIGENMWIQTATGKRFDLLEPKPEQVHPEDIISALPFIPCFTGQQQANKFQYAYSVAQHCHLVSNLVEDDLALDALLHDAWKIYVSDLTKPLNQLLNQISGNEWGAVRGRIQATVAERFNLQYPLPDAIEQGDMMARATELRDIMAPAPEPWSLKLPKPFNYEITPYAPSVVRDLFQTRWLGLTFGKFIK